MVPKLDQRRGYASKPGTYLRRSVALKQGKKPTTGPLMSQEKGQELRQITWKHPYFSLHNFRDGVHLCLEALEEALDRRTPTIFNTDQGSQFTSLEFASRLEQKGVQIR